MGRGDGREWKGGGVHSSPPIIPEKAGAPIDSGKIQFTVLEAFCKEAQRSGWAHRRVVKRE